MSATSWTGSLLYWRLRPDAAQSWELPGHVDQEPSGVPGWRRVILTTAEPIDPRDLRSPGLPHGFQYPHLLRQSGDHLLLVSTNAASIPVLLRRLELSSSLAPPSVNVPRLTEEFVARPGDYCLGVVFARIDGFGQSLRTIAFYGDDLADASLFKELLPSLLPRRVTLRDVRLNIDVLSIGSRGDISFILRDDPAGLRQIDACLRYLSARELLDWSARLEDQ